MNSDEYMTIPLTKGLLAKVDPEDYQTLVERKWSAEHGYAVSGHDTPKLRMHRVVMNAPDGTFVDHKNGDKTDCRKSNLRICSRAQNNRNVKRRNHARVSRFKCVTWFSHISKWGAYIRVNRKRIHLGVYYSEEEAALAYNTAALEHFGEFALLNEL